MVIADARPGRGDSVDFRNVQEWVGIWWDRDEVIVPWDGKRRDGRQNIGHFLNGNKKLYLCVRFVMIWRMLLLAVRSILVTRPLVATLVVMISRMLCSLLSFRSILTIAPTYRSQWARFQEQRVVLEFPRTTHRSLLSIIGL